jgi:hypothetical protein
MLLRESLKILETVLAPNSGGISAEFLLVKAIACSKFLNRLNLVEKVYKPFEPSGIKNGNRNGYNRV